MGWGWVGFDEGWVGFEEVRLGIGGGGGWGMD